MSLETVVEDIRDEARARAEEVRTDGEGRGGGSIESRSTVLQYDVGEFSCFEHNL